MQSCTIWFHPLFLVHLYPLYNRQEDTSDWLLNDDLVSWSGTPVEQGWRYLRRSLQQYDNAETDYRYSKATLETILGADRKSSPPPWLINILEVYAAYQFDSKMSLTL